MSASTFATSRRDGTRRQFRLVHMMVAMFCVSLTFALGSQGFIFTSLALAILQFMALAYWWFRHWLAPVVVLGLSWWILLPPVCTMPVEVAREMHCRGNLRNISLALSHYEIRYGSLPPAYVVDASGQPLYSWRVLLLPYLDEDYLYRQFHLDEPWDSPHNLALARHMPATFACPGMVKARGLPRDSVLTSYVAVVDPKSIWPGATACKHGDATDGSDSTLLVVEWPNSDIVWTEPRDASANELAAHMRQPPRKTRWSGRPEEHTQYRLLHVRVSGVASAWDLGAVSPQKVDAMITRAGQEKVDVDP